MENDIYIVRKDGVELFRGTHNECFGFIHKNQGQSVDYATKWGGYSIDSITPEETHGRDIR